MLWMSIAVLVLLVFLTFVFEDRHTVVGLAGAWKALGAVLLLSGLQVLVLTAGGDTFTAVAFLEFLGWAILGGIVFILGSSNISRAEPHAQPYQM